MWLEKLALFSIVVAIVFLAVLVNVFVVAMWCRSK